MVERIAAERATGREDASHARPGPGPARVPDLARSVPDLARPVPDLARPVPDLGAAYQRCRSSQQRHGRSYYLATLLLPAWKRRHVHALYGFTRHADDLVDSLDQVATTERLAAERAAKLAAWGDRLRAGLAGAPVDDPLLVAVLHTIAVWRLDVADFDTFLRSMAMDLHVAGYATYQDLLDYMEGSAAVIGTMMLPILAPADRAAAREPARQLGLAFQLTNFIRDVREDLRRGRVYLPEEDLRRFGVTRADLWHAAARGSATPEIKALIAFEVQRARGHYAAAVPGIQMLPARSRACVRAAFEVYGAILDEVARQGYDVLRRRAVVPNGRRLLLAARAALARPGAPLPPPGPAPSGEPVAPPTIIVPARVEIAAPAPVPARVEIPPAAPVPARVDVAAPAAAAAAGAGTGTAEPAG